MVYRHVIFWLSYWTRRSSENFIRTLRCKWCSEMMREGVVEVKGLNPRTFQNHLESKSRSVRAVIQSNGPHVFLLLRVGLLWKVLLQYQEHIKNNALYIYSHVPRIPTESCGIVKSTRSNLWVFIDDLKWPKDRKSRLEDSWVVGHIFVVNARFCKKTNLESKSNNMLPKKCGWQHVYNNKTKNNQPTNQPTSQPTNQPTNQPTKQPTTQPTNQPTNLGKWRVVRIPVGWYAIHAGAQLINDERAVPRWQL